jgi:serine/threonine protein kinase
LQAKNYLCFGSICINRLYGFTRNPKNGEYAIVTEFQNGGNLREMLKKNFSILNFKLIFTILSEICTGLGTIHSLNYCHKDFHSGNILNRIYGDNFTIVPAVSDFGLSCSTEQHSTDKAPYGVLPFVAPEVLRGGEFTKEADIYGFGMLMSEVISGEAPFFDRDYDVHLALDICNGERPLIPEYAPEQYIALMKRCLDPVPTNRPSTNDLYAEFNIWLFNLNVFSQEQEDKWKTRLAELATNPRPLKKSQNSLTSKRLDYSKHLSQLLEKKDIEMKTNDDSMLFYLIIFEKSK